MEVYQKFLLRIVRTWDLKSEPEHRGFRCANCQEYMKKAWHHWLNIGGYKTPVHFCRKCEADFLSFRIKVKNPEREVAKGNFKYNLPNIIKEKLQRIADRWDVGGAPIYKVFVCDNCQRKMDKAWHIWFFTRKILVEAHLCKECGKELGVAILIKGLIYDLDGTLVQTAKLHEAGWLYAGKKFGVKISKKMLQNQRGISNRTAGLMMLPSRKRHILNEFIATKAEYVFEHLNQIKSFPGQGPLFAFLL